MTKTGTRPVFVFGGKEFSNFRFRSLFTKICVAKLQQLFQSTNFFRKKKRASHFCKALCNTYSM